MIDFPASPTENQMFQAPGGPRYVYSNGAWRMSDPGPPGTAQARNRIANGAMRISQELGNTSTGSVINFVAYLADQWFAAGSGFSGGVVTGQRVQVVTLYGSTDRIRVTNGANTVPDASAAMYFGTNIEGGKVSDFRWGTAQAKQVILRFGWKSPAGTYTVIIRNGAYNRTYAADFVISAGQANTDTTQTIVIPGDTTGAWATDNTLGMEIGFCIAAGAGYTSPLGWSATGGIRSPNTSNGMATNGNVFELFDVGLYLDPLATGVAPRWEMPDEAQELAACMRYWGKGTATGHNTIYSGGYFKATMRTTPAMGFSGTASPNSADPSGFSYGASATAVFNWTANARM